MDDNNPTSNQSWAVIPAVAFATLFLVVAGVYIGNNRSAQTSQAQQPAVTPIYTNPPQQFVPPITVDELSALRQPAVGSTIGEVMIIRTVFNITASDAARRQASLAAARWCNETIALLQKAPEYKPDAKYIMQFDTIDGYSLAIGSPFGFQAK